VVRGWLARSGFLTTMQYALTTVEVPFQLLHFAGRGV